MTCLQHLREAPTLSLESVPKQCAGYTTCTPHKERLQSSAFMLIVKSATKVWLLLADTGPL